MRKWLLTLAAVATSLTASAQNYYIKCNEPCYDNFAPTWAMLRGFQGFYVGGNGGFLSLRSDSSDLDSYLAALGTLSASRTNWAAGVQVGYDCRFCNKVFGIVADWEWSNARTRFRELPNDPDVIQQGIDHKMQWFTTIRARGGFALNDIMVYLTAGGVVADFKAKILNNVMGFTAEHHSFNKHRWGWTVGFGGEFIIWKNWSINAEVLYLHFEHNRLTFTSPLKLGNTFSFDLLEEAWVGRLGLNFHFSLCDFW